MGSIIPFFSDFARELNYIGLHKSRRRQQPDLRHRLTQIAKSNKIAATERTLSMQRRRLLHPSIILSLSLLLVNAVSSEAASDEQHERGHHHQHNDHDCTGHSHQHASGEDSSDPGMPHGGPKTTNIRRHPVHLYKGAEPWRPLSNSIPLLGVRPVELSAATIDEEEQSPAENEPRHLAMDGPPNNVPLKVSGTINGFAPINITAEPLAESTAFDYNENAHEGEKERSKSALHESLRRPLKRLTDRQLALLLKQIRKQRRGQFGQSHRETDQTAVPEMNAISTRQQMLAQIKDLLKQPQNGQHLIRPKLLTNVNILPNEWNIYPVPRDRGVKNGTNRDQKSGEKLDERQQQQQQNGGLLDGRPAGVQQKQPLSVYTIEIGGHLYDLSEEQPPNGTEGADVLSASAPTRPLTTSTTDHPLLTSPQFEVKATIRPPIVQSIALLSEQITESERTATQATKNLPSHLSNSALKVEQQPSPKLETDQHQRQENTNQNQNNSNGTATAAKLESGWQLVEQKFMAEMRTVVQKADSAIEKLESQRRKSTKTPNNSHFKNKTETPSSPVIFASKTFDLNNKNNDSDNDQSEFKVHNVSHFAEQERSQLGELSHALREIRLRYETVKRQFVSKMKRLGLAHRFKTPPQSKAAGTTTFIEEDAQNGTNQTEFGQNLNNETLSNTDNGTIGIAPEGTTAEQQSVETKTLASQEAQTTAVPIPNSSKNTRKPSVEHKNVNNETNEEESIQNIGKTKPKLTLTELAAELEQIERTIATRNGKAGLKELEIESGTLQKAKKILQKGKKSRQKGRARVFSSPPPDNESPKALVNAGSSPSGKLIQALKTIKAAATHRDGHQHKAEKQPQKQKSRGNNNEVPIRAETTGQPTKSQQQQAVQQLSHSTQQQQPSQTRLPIPFVKITPKSKILLSPSTPDISKLKTVIVDTSTQNGHSDVQHQQQQPKILHSQQNNQLHQQTQQQHFQPQNHQPQQVQQQLHSPSFQQQQHFQSVQHNQMPQQHPTQPSQQQQQHHEQQQHQQLDHPQQQPEQQRAFVQHPQQLTQLPQRLGHGQSVRTNAEDGGFYQLERAQVTNVSQKVPKPPASSELKLKGVAQLAVSKGNGPQSPAEISSSQLGSQLRKEKLGKNGTKQPKEDDDLANLEEFARIDEQAICDAIACNFETGTLCEWETSVDELNPNDPRYRRYMMARTVLLTRRRRSKRNDEEFVRDEEEEEEEMADFGQNLLLNSVEETTTMATATTTTTRKKPDQTTDSKPPQAGRTVLRSWHNWVGRYRNRLTGISQSEVFSTRNQRFAASYLKAGQRSTLTGRLLSGDRTTIRFRAWEATRALQLRVCCDRTDRDENCVFETELGAKRASRQWKDHLATCPQGTKKIIFECRNNGPFQGACGVDNIQLVNAYCPSVTPMKANRMLK